jgi:hypothetical protein
MSILNAIREARHDNNNLEDLAKLPQVLIMQMAQNGQIQKEMLMPILGKKAEMAENTAKMNAAKALAAQGGAQPTVMEQYMGQIAQAENPAPAMPQQEMQQPMPQEMAQAPMPQGPEDVGIASQATAPMQLAGGGIIAFDEGGDVDEDGDYQESIEDAQEAAMGNRLFEMIAGLKGSSGERDSERGDSGFGIKAGRGEDKGDLADRLRAVIMQRESGGRRYDKEGNLLTSSKGAQGEMQVMPGTAKDPGFGIKAARNNSPDELRRVGDEYASMLLNRYQDPKLAMIAYNMGPGATDRWLAAGADIKKLPKETQGYIRGVNLASGGEVKHYAGGGGTMGEFSAFSDEDNAMDALRLESLVEERKRKEYEDKYNFLKNSAPEVAAKMKPPVIKKSAEEPAKTVAAPAPAKDAPPQTKIPQSPEGIKNLQAKADDENFNLMQYIKGREAKIDKASMQDKNMALLAAGLGMLGGTSQYAFENIGKGGLAGVQQLAASQKTRAAQEAALGKLYGSAAQTDLMNKLRRDQLAQGKEKADEDRAQRLTTAKSAELGRRLKLRGITDEMIGMLEQKQALKTIKPEELTKLNLFKQQMQKIKDDVNTEFASNTSGFSARKIG